MTTSIHFSIHFFVTAGEHLIIQSTEGDHELEKIWHCNSYDGAHWSVLINPIQGNEIRYRYGIMKMDGSIKYEAWGYRSLNIGKANHLIYIQDSWRSKLRQDSIFYSKPFRNVFFKRDLKKPSLKINPNVNMVSFTLHSVNVPIGKHLGIIGDLPELGQWQYPLLIKSGNFPVWQADIEHAGHHIKASYKYVICDDDGHILEWESGENRTLDFHFPTPKGHHLQVADETFHKETPTWKGCGIALPVFSLRTKNSLGIGEFTDLKAAIDFCHQTGMQVLQTLPVNDTLATKTWKDSYPYAAISVFALHPLYVNIEEIAPFSDQKIIKSYQKDLKRLNESSTLDFEAVLKAKWVYFKHLYKQEFNRLKRTKSYQSFIAQNAHWIHDYAAFCVLRDRNGSVDFNSWGEFSTYQKEKIRTLLQHKDFMHEAGLYYFIQYHADRQLKEARNYGRERGVVMKGDLPIGIYRYSCDAWVAPHLYNMDEQAGAPPDAYATLGQNWGFPTYKWSAMAEDDFLWWQNRMKQLAVYFDVLRIDHILGFFRIWSIPLNQVQGTMGLFNPRKPMLRSELSHYGIYGDLDRYTRPYLEENHLKRTLGTQYQSVKNHFLIDKGNGFYQFKEAFTCQRDLKNYLDQSEDQELKSIEKQILSLMSEVLLIEEPHAHGTAVNPRITLQTTHSYKSLSDYERNCFDRLYIDYFYHRHTEFWKSQALWKLPALLDATDMLICGEDLGMIPDGVAEVMTTLNILPLDIQRMPKGPTTFGVTEAYPYYGVCSPSCHDMSTIRGWWEGNADIAQKFYNEVMQMNGKAPKKCNTEIASFIIKKHIKSPSMLSIFPLQDLLALNEEWKHPDPTAEQINEPSDPNHYWRYRIHFELEDLLKDQTFMSYIQDFCKR